MWLRLCRVSGAAPALRPLRASPHRTLRSLLHHSTSVLAARGAAGGGPSRIASTATKSKAAARKPSAKEAASAAKTAKTVRAAASKAAPAAVTDTVTPAATRGRPRTTRSNSKAATAAASSDAPPASLTPSPAVVAAVSAAQVRGSHIATGGNPNAPLGALEQLRGAQAADFVWSYALAQVRRERAVDGRYAVPAARARDRATRKLQALSTAIAAVYHPWLASCPDPNELHPYEFALIELSLPNGVAEYRATVRRVHMLCVRIERYTALAVKLLARCTTAQEVLRALQLCTAQIEDMVFGVDDDPAPQPDIDELTAPSKRIKADARAAAETAAQAEADADAEAEADAADAADADAETRRMNAELEVDPDAPVAGDDADDAASAAEAPHERDRELTASTNAGSGSADRGGRAASAASELGVPPGDALLAVHRALKALHLLDGSRPTVALVGAPNVGKSSLVRALSTGTPAVANYPFTTRGISSGHMVVPLDPPTATATGGVGADADAPVALPSSTDPVLEVQVTDTPGLLHRDDTARNKPEHFTLALLTHMTSTPMPPAAVSAAVAATARARALGRPNQRLSTSKLAAATASTAAASAAASAATAAAVARGESLTPRRPVIVYVVDVSGHSSFALAMQLKLRAELYDRFVVRGGGAHKWIDVVTKADLGLLYYRFVNPKTGAQNGNAGDATATAATTTTSTSSRRRGKASAVPLEWREQTVDLTDHNTLQTPLTRDELLEAQRRATQLLGYTPDAFVSTASGQGLGALRARIADVLLGRK